MIIFPSFAFINEIKDCKSLGIKYKVFKNDEKV